MRRAPILVAGLLAGVPALFLLPSASPAVAAAPVHTLTVDGTGVGSYPAFDPTVERYAVTTAAATGGALTVQATTSDPAGVVRVDGRVAPGGTATVTGLAGGDEVSVFIEDSAGVEVHSLVYLPAGFPALETVTTSPDVAAGQIGLTLFVLSPTFPRFATTVDRNGVPTHVEKVVNSLDLKQQPDGSITLTAPTESPVRTGSAVVVKDDQWHEVGRHETVGLTDTDNHDSILMPDGSRFLLAYEPNEETGRTDAVVQEVDAQNHVVFQWSSASVAGESVRPGTEPDYAHVNSIQVLEPERDVVVSFRHFSSVYRIATRDHDGHQAGDIIWKLGGRDSDFSFVDDPYGGPCAQHSAKVLSTGNILLFDNGSGGTFAPDLCLDQADPGGVPFARPQSRAVEYALDPVQGTATQVWDYSPAGRYTPFMGSTARFGNGDTLIGWGGSPSTLASEVAADGSLLWELRVAQPAPPYLSYRASLMHVPDAFPPKITLGTPLDGARFVLGQQVAADFGCTDVGGSSLRSCAGDLRPGERLDTSTPGTHTVHLTATDGAGNTTTVTRSYTVTAAYAPRWRERAVSAAIPGPRAALRVHLVNDGTYADAFRIVGPRAGRAVSVRYLVDGEDVTRAVRRGRFRTDPVAVGGVVRLRVLLARTERSRPGARYVLRLLAASVADPHARDVVRVVARIPR